VVLAGGGSRRLGRDKALVEVGGRTLVEHVAGALGAAGATELVVVGGDAPALEGLGLHVVGDRWPGEGPLGGVITGLEAVRHSLAVVCACDLPFLAPDLVRSLVDDAVGSAADVVVPVTAGRLQPLLAAYRTSAVTALRRAFDAGERSISAALAALTVQERPLSEQQSGSAHDVDTPEDLAGARDRAGDAIS
jgi:molybdenum cofactor guanylyltransferase